MLLFLPLVSTELSMRGEWGIGIYSEQKFKKTGLFFFFSHQAFESLLGTPGVPRMQNHVLEC